MGGYKMNKKQAVIIVALLALIVCAGVLATKLNSPLYVNGTDSSTGSSTVSFNNNGKNTGTNSEFFTETKMIRDQKNTQTLQTLKSLIDDKNVSKENKDDASKKYTKLAMNTNYEAKIETTLKSKGYADAVCLIEDNKATVIVKTSGSAAVNGTQGKLSDKSTRDIQNVVLSVAKISDVEIQTK